MKFHAMRILPFFGALFLGGCAATVTPATVAVTPIPPPVVVAPLTPRVVVAPVRPWWGPRLRYWR